MESFPEIAARAFAAREEAARQRGERTASGADCLGGTHGSPLTGCTTLDELLNLSGLFPPLKMGLTVLSPSEGECED